MDEPLWDVAQQLVGVRVELLGVEADAVGRRSVGVAVASDQRQALGARVQSDAAEQASDVVL